MGPDDVEKLRHLLGEFSHPSVSSGKWNPRPGTHIGTKEAIFHPEGTLLAGRTLLSIRDDLDPSVDAVASDGVGGSALAVAMCVCAQLRGEPLTPLHVRQQPRSREPRRLVEGLESITRPSRVAVIDDTIDTGRTAYRMIEILQNEGLAVTAAIFLVARTSAGVERLIESGLTVRALFQLADIATSGA